MIEKGHNSRRVLTSPNRSIMTQSALLFSINVFIIQIFKMERENGLMRTVGETIRSDRKARGFTLKQLGQRIGVSIATLHRIETDEISPSLELLERLSAQLERPLLYFFKMQGE